MQEGNRVEEESINFAIAMYEDELEKSRREGKPSKGQDGQSQES